MDNKDMDIKRLSEITGTQRIEELKNEAQKKKGLEYRYLWVSVNFATIKDEHVNKIGARGFGVFMVIRTFADKDGVAYPSLKTIAHLSGCSVSSIQKEINKLIKYMWIKKTGRVITKDGKLGNTKYQILQNDLIRGTGQKGYIEKPLVKYTNGE